MTRRAPSPGRPWARPGVLAAVALIAAAGIIVFVLGRRITGVSPASSASPSSSPAVAAALAALLRQGTPDTAPGYWGEAQRRAGRAAAAGADDARFRALGALLVKDGTDVYDWYGGPHGTYPHTASGQPYQLADYPDALAAFRQGVSGARRS